MSVENTLRTIIRETYALYSHVQECHFEAREHGPPGLVDELEAQSTELFEAIDRLVARLRALGAAAPAGLREIPLAPSDSSRAHDIPALRAGHEAIGDALRDAVTVCARANDRRTGALLSARLAAHDKTLWMLDSQPAPRTTRHH